LKYIPENAFVTSINEKVGKLLRTVSDDVTFKQSNETKYINNTVNILKIDISVLLKHAQNSVNSNLLI
jgi:hypothetical protein